jgi:hypothetical protein
MSVSSNIGRQYPRQNPTVSVNGDSIKGSLVGQGASPCWSPRNNYVYRAEVPIYLLYIGGNGDYQISGIPSNDGRGINPWAPAPGQPLAEGATIVIFFTRNSGNNSTTYVYDSPISGTMFASQFSTDLTGFNANKSTATFTTIGADGQVGSGYSAVYTVTTENTFFQGTQIAGYSASPSAFQDADSDWNGNDGFPLNQLWDSSTHIVPIKPNSTSANVRYTSNGDCLVVCSLILTI